VTTSDDRTILFATAPSVGEIVEVIGREVSGDIVTLTGGAMTAGRTYEVAGYDFVHDLGQRRLPAPRPGLIAPSRR
jgi:hypothetical protein